MENNPLLKGRRKLKAKMTMTFGEELKDLSTELKQIMIDDMATAFENRLKVFNLFNDIDHT